MRPNQPARQRKSIYRYVQNYPREMQTNSLIFSKNPQTNGNKSADFSAFGSGFRCIQNQSLDKCKQISQFKAHENGFGFVQNQPLKENTNHFSVFTDFSACENGLVCIQNQSLDKCEQISQFKAHENGFGCVQNQPSAKCK